MLTQLHKILDIAKCYEILRFVLWNNQVVCKQCKSFEVIKNGKDPIDKAYNIINVSLWVESILMI